MQGNDNEYYLHTMFDGSPNAAGTLFVDSRIPEGIKAKNCIIYGHNMNDGSMFGTLGKFADPEFYKAHKTFHVYTPEHHYMQYNNSTIRIYDRERMLIELMRFRNKIPMDYYKEIIQSYRNLSAELDIGLAEDYASMFRNGAKLMNMIQMEVL